MPQLPPHAAHPDEGPPLDTFPRAPSRTATIAVLAAALLLALALLPLDGALSELAQRFRVRGDVRREFELLQQFGSVTTVAITAALIALLDPQRLRRMLDWAAAALITWLVTYALKMSIARPRPSRGLGGAWGAEGNPWAFWRDGAAELWSMPSSHTAFAVVLAVFLTAAYPRLKPFAIAMAVLVAWSRVMFGAHFPSDVVAGAAIAWAISAHAIHRYWGVRALDWLWIRFVDPRATPEFPRVRALEPTR